MRGHGAGELYLSNYQGHGGPLVTSPSGKFGGEGGGGVEELPSYSSTVMISIAPM